MGNDTAHREGFGRIPPQDGPQADGETILDRKGKWMGVSPAGGSNGGGRIIVGVILNLTPPTHSRIFHCYQAHYLSVSSGGTESGVKSGQAVVGARQLRLGWDADGGSGDGIDRRGGIRTIWGRIWTRIKLVGRLL